MTCVAATPIACVVCEIDRPSNFETATAAPIDPVVEVMCLRICQFANLKVSDTLRDSDLRIF